MKFIGEIIGTTKKLYRYKGNSGEIKEKEKYNEFLVVW